MDEGLTTAGFDRRVHEGAAMPKRLVLSLVALFVCCACAAPALADAQFGVQAIVLSGTHFSPKGDVKDDDIVDDISNSIISGLPTFDEDNSGHCQLSGRSPSML